MDDSVAREREWSETLQAKRDFLAAAIADISSYIHLVDMKVSLLMTAVIALLVGMLTCANFIEKAFANIAPCSWCGVLLVVLSIALVVGIIGMYAFGILTIRVRSSKIEYSSKWFLGRSISEYSFETYKADVFGMSNVDVVENMVAELYKLNDINRRKQSACKWALRFFSAILIFLFTICLILLIAALGGC